MTDEPVVVVATPDQPVVVVVAHDQTVKAHDQKTTIHLLEHVQAHPPRIPDCTFPGPMELHHSVVEHSEQGGVDIERLDAAYGLHLANDGDFQVWLESPGNLDVLCPVHHRTYLGIHVLPEPFWSALRIWKSGLAPPAEVVPCPWVSTFGRSRSYPRERLTATIGAPSIPRGTTAPRTEAGISASGVRSGTLRRPRLPRFHDRRAALLQDHRIGNAPALLGGLGAHRRRFLPGRQSLRWTAPTLRG
jgi:hypothetical protein